MKKKVGSKLGSEKEIADSVNDSDLKYFLFRRWLGGNLCQRKPTTILACFYATVY